MVLIEVSFITEGFPHSSVGKESTCNAGDPSSIPGLGRSTGEGKGFSLQYSWASLVAQLVKNPPAMRALQNSCLGNSMDRGDWQATVHVFTKSDMTE